MHTDQAGDVRTRTVDQRRRLQDVQALLHAVASSGGIHGAARDNLDEAIRSIQSMIGELAALCDWQTADASGGSLQDSRVLEAKSEVDSGEFDMHG
jgi:hypothetical protein